MWLPHNTQIQANSSYEGTMRLPHDTQTEANSSYEGTMRVSARANSSYEHAMCAPHSWLGEGFELLCHICKRPELIAITQLHLGVVWAPLINSYNLPHPATNILSTTKLCSRH